MTDPATERQLKLLEKEDWRFHAIGPGGTGLMMLATTERRSKLSKQVLSFGLPSAPALYLSLAIDARDRRKKIDVSAVFVEHPKPQGIYPDEHEALFDFFQEFSAEVIFSFTALEAFANEMIPTNFTYDWTNGKKATITLSASEIERQVSLDEKLKVVLPRAHGISSPAGTKPWEQFKSLKRVRDRLVHLKSIDRKSSGPEHQTIWGLMISEKDGDFASAAYSVISAYPSLVKDRRWHRLAGELVK